MSLQGSAFLAMWHDIASEGETEYNDWHTREHMAERVGIPGFLVGRRYVNWSLELYRYFTIYEGQDLSTFNSAAYLERLNSPTPWTNQMQPHFRNFIRAACTTVVSSGQGIGGALLTARVDFAEGGRAAFVSAARALPERLGALHGVSGVHVGVVERTITNVRTTETELRQSGDEAAYDAAVLAEGIGRRELEALRSHVEEALTTDSGVAHADIAVYDLAYVLIAEPRAGA